MSPKKKTKRTTRTSKKATSSRRSNKFNKALYLTLLIWPVALCGLIYFQLQQRSVEVDEEMNLMEQKYQEEIAELELQNELLRRQIELND